jgi:DNA-binding response OmpR family regulator
VSKQSLLLVDGDTRSLRVLEVSLRKAGFSVTPAVSVADALDKLGLHAPDLIISETRFDAELDGFELRRRLRASPEWAEIPFIFLTAETAIENKIRGLELGVDDYLTKPIYIKEIVTRINILLAKRQRQFLDLRKDGTRFAGRVADMPVVDVIQTIEVSRKSGVIQFVAGPTRQAAIYFRDGKVIDAESGTLQGEDAVYRLLTWSDGEFEVEFRTVRRREAISTSSQGLLMEGMRRLDEWSRLLEQLPPLTHRFEIDFGELSTRLGEVPDDNNRILRLFDGKRTLLEVIEASDFGDLECLQAISRLYFEGLLIDLDPQVRARRESGRPGPLEEIPTPIEEVASGPIDLTALAARAGQGPAVLSAPEPMVAPAGRETSGEIITDQEVISEEDSPPLEPGPLMGGYRPSGLRLIDEAVAAAQAIEPSLFEPEELAALAAVRANEVAAAAASPTPSGPPKPPSRRTPTLPPPLPTTRPAQTASPVPAPDVAETGNGAARARTKSIPPPLPASALARAQRELDDAPLLDAEPYTSGEYKIPTEEELAQAPLLEAEPYTSGEHKLPTAEELQDFSSDEDYSGVPTVIEAGEEPDDLGEERPTDPSRRRPAPPVVARPVVSSSVRMIGSHGRDRAEASGELKPAAAKPPPPAAAGHEVVTIQPRRVAREQSAGTGEVASPVEPPRRQPAAARPRMASVGGGTSAAGPSRGLQVTLVAGSILLGAALYLYMKRPAGKPRAAAVTADAAERVVVMTPADAFEYPTGFGVDAAERAVIVAPIDAAVVAVAPPIDAAVVAVAPPIDAAVVAVAPPIDAAAAVTPVKPPEPAVDRNREAKTLYDKGRTALEDGDTEEALALLEQSLALRRVASTYLERARALQRLGRIDDAVASIDQAIALNPKGAQGHEQKGMLLWSVRRYDEARPALEKYLELAPDGRSAGRIRAMLDESR